MKKDLIKFYVKDILLYVFIIIISIPIWQTMNLTNVKKEAEYYDNYNYISYEFKKDNVSYSLNPISDMDALRKVEMQSVLISNYYNTLDDYSLIIKINKITDTTNLKINVNYEVKYINDYKSYEDENYIYYIIDEDSIMAKSQNYLISMWNCDGCENNNTLDYELMVL